MQSNRYVCDKWRLEILYSSGGIYVKKKKSQNNYGKFWCLFCRSKTSWTHFVSWVNWVGVCEEPAFGRWLRSLAEQVIKQKMGKYWGCDTFIGIWNPRISGIRRNPCGSLCQDHCVRSEQTRETSQGVCKRCSSNSNSVTTKCLCLSQQKYWASSSSHTATPTTCTLLVQSQCLSHTWWHVDNLGIVSNTRSRLGDTNTPTKRKEWDIVYLKPHAIMCCKDFSGLAVKRPTCDPDFQYPQSCGLEDVESVLKVLKSMAAEQSQPEQWKPPPLEILMKG